MLKKQPPIDDVIYLESDSNYTIYHLKNGCVFISSKTLKQSQQELQFSLFLRIHKSYLLNPNFINKISKERNKLIVVLKNGTQLSVSRRKALELKEDLRKFLE